MSSNKYYEIICNNQVVQLSKLKSNNMVTGDGI